MADAYKIVSAVMAGTRKIGPSGEQFPPHLQIAVGDIVIDEPNPQKRTWTEITDKLSLMKRTLASRDYDKTEICNALKVMYILMETFVRLARVLAQY